MNRFLSTACLRCRGPLSVDEVRLHAACVERLAADDHENILDLIRALTDLTVEVHALRQAFAAHLDHGGHEPPPARLTLHRGRPSRLVGR